MRKCLFLVLGAGVLLLSVGLIARAQGGYDLSWWTVDGGGYTVSTGGGYELGGTIGQPDAGAMIGGAYTLVGGFWGGGAVSGTPGPHRIYLPLVLR